MPAVPGQLSLFRGKAALPTHVLGISSFSKAFFTHPSTEQLYGRVLLGKGPLGDLLFPLYFRADVGPAVVPSERGAGAPAAGRAAQRRRRHSDRKGGPPHHPTTPCSPARSHAGAVRRGAAVLTHSVAAASGT